MTKTKKPCEQVYPWLRANFGPNCLAPLTSTDSRALDAAVQIIELWAFDSEGDETLRAFEIVVLRMQPHTRQLAYHAIAHVVNWEDRERVWKACSLPPVANPWRAKFEPAQREVA